MTTKTFTATDLTQVDPDLAREIRKERRRIARIARRARTDAHVRSRTVLGRASRNVTRGPVLRVLVAMLRWLPLPVAAALGHVFGALAWTFVPKLRKRTLAHLEIAFGDEKSVSERKAVARRSVALLGRGLFSLFVLHRMGPERAFRQVEAEGREVVDEALAAGRPVILLGAHFGLFELMGGWCGRNIDARTVGRAATPGSPTEFLVKMREEMGVSTIQRGDARDVIRCFRSGRPVGLLVDHDLSDARGVFVPFFGRLAHTVNGPAALALRHDVLLAPVFVEWTSLTRHRVFFEEPVELPRDLPRKEAVLELTLRISAMIERVIRRRPDHWIWLHQRWKSRPEDDPSLQVYEGRTDPQEGT